MDFVERWFGIAPDGGSGIFEASIIVAVLIVGCALVLRGRLQTMLYHQMSKVAWLK